MAGKFLVLFLIIALILISCDARKMYRKAMVLRQKETNAVNFIRLAAMRLVYGIATRMGLGEQISEALNGAFVPPGVDDYDYDQGVGLFDGDDDDDYDY